MTEEHKKKIGEALKGKMPKNIKLIAGWNKGKKMPELSKKYKGKGNPMYGKKQWNDGIKIDREKYPTMGHWKKHSEETKKKLSENSKGQHWANIDHQYKRNLNDFISLCPKCHRVYDLVFNL